MNATQRQYLFGLIFFCVGVYQAYLRDYLEFSLFAIAGLAFVANALTFEPKFLRYKKPLVVISWILIVASGILFFYVLQFNDISWK